MTEQSWLWLGFAGMAAGAALIFLIGRSRTPREGIATLLHGVVPVIAACSYFAMAAGQGSIVLPGTTAGTPGYTFYFARYVDWAFTTPILLASLALSAQHAGTRRAWPLVGLLLADVLMIVTALFFGLSTVSWIKWTWFAISCGAFAAVYYVLWLPLRDDAAAQREDVRTAYASNAAILSVIWFLYPVVLLADPEGLNVIGSTTSVAAFAVLDLVAKVGFGLLATVRHGRIAEADRREGAATPDRAPRLARAA